MATGVDADLGEADGELLVEAEESAHVWQHDHTWAGRRFGSGMEGGELNAVGRGQGQVFNINGGSGDRSNRGQRFVSVAHVRYPLWLLSALRG